eukprot:comp21385_c0_seq1/m.46146 comp21385_c0_seq1/g.46146  ORF comp21385_c0_seq1/g.46146 comp21385_c0_seq1/m.46146 type:complete len:454 (-) comp21385_c0_seq1:98-1459(-)
MSFAERYDTVVVGSGAFAEAIVRRLHMAGHTVFTCSAAQIASAGIHAQLTKRTVQTVLARAETVIWLGSSGSKESGNGSEGNGGGAIGADRWILDEALDNQAHVVLALVHRIAQFDTLVDDDLARVAAAFWDTGKADPLLQRIAQHGSGNGGGGKAQHTVVLPVLDDASSAGASSEMANERAVHRLLEFLRSEREVAEKRPSSESHAVASTGDWDRLAKLDPARDYGLRLAGFTPDDAAYLLYLRNDRDTISGAINQHPVPLSDHMHWLYSAVTHGGEIGRFVFVFQALGQNLDEIKIGSGRIDAVSQHLLRYDTHEVQREQDHVTPAAHIREDEQPHHQRRLSANTTKPDRAQLLAAAGANESDVVVELSWTLDPRIRNRGLAATLIRQLEQVAVARIRPVPTLLVAVIRHDNMASNKAAQKCGFLPSDSGAAAAGVSPHGLQVWTKKTSEA